MNKTPPLRKQIQCLYAGVDEPSKRANNTHTCLPVTEEENRRRSEKWKMAIASWMIRGRSLRSGRFNRSKCFLNL